MRWGRRMSLADGAAGVWTRIAEGVGPRQLPQETAQGDGSDIYTASTTGGLRFPGRGRSTWRALRVGNHAGLARVHTLSALHVLPLGSVTRGRRGRVGLPSDSPTRRPGAARHLVAPGTVGAVLFIGGSRGLGQPAALSEGMRPTTPNLRTGQEPPGVDCWRIGEDALPCQHPAGAASA